MKRSDAIPYVSFVVDDAGCGRQLHADRHAIVREGGDSTRDETTGSVAIETDDGPYTHRSVLVGWQCGFEPLFVAVHSYLDVRLTVDDAADMAREYLDEIGWFADDDDEEDREPDYVIA